LGWFESAESQGSLEPDIDRYNFLEMLLLAENKPLQPYGLARRIDPARQGGLGHKLKHILDSAKLRIAGRKEAEDITDEEIRLQALEFVKKHIVFSSLTVDEHRQWDAAERVVAAMQAKCDRGMEELDAFIRSRTKGTT
jgi:hypothetical protein